VIVPHVSRAAITRHPESQFGIKLTENPNLRGATSSCYAALSALDVLANRITQTRNGGTRSKPGGVNELMNAS